jgi:hypothetical protein
VLELLFLHRRKYLIVFYLSVNKTNMKTNYFSKLLLKLFVFVLLTLGCDNVDGQDCTVNAGLDASYCFAAEYPNQNQINSLFSLSGNAAGNINLAPNKLWELASGPQGANLTFTNPTNNTTTITGRYRDLPSGTYIFRLGIDCQTGGRVYDSVKITIDNVADFELYGDRKWNYFCGNDTAGLINLISRPLRVGERLQLQGAGVLIYGNTTTVFSGGNSMLITGPTSDSVRLISKNNNFSCNKGGAFIRYDIYSASVPCRKQYIKPILTGTIAEELGNTKTVLYKVGSKKIDTISCLGIPPIYYYFLQENICFTGSSDNSNPPNISSIRLSGSGSVISNGNVYTYPNNWDTVSRNTLHTYEITVNSNGCFDSFKDTIKIFFKSAFNASNIIFNNGLSPCVDPTFQLNDYRYQLLQTGVIVPPAYKFNSIIYGQPLGSNVYISNPQGKDSLFFSGTMRPGTYGIYTTITDTTSGCSTYVTTSFGFRTKTTLPLLRDTTVCFRKYGQIPIPYYYTEFGCGAYLTQKIGGNGLAFATVPCSNYIYVSMNTVGTTDFRVYPDISNQNACVDNKSDTFRVVTISSGHNSNAGTDQLLLCNVNNTNLAGILPVSPVDGIEGFWKFLPAISSNVGAPIVIADSADKSTGISGFVNQSSYYFSWNVTDGNTGTYCNLKPDTVLVVYSGIPPSIAQSAQADYTGILSGNHTFNITSNAVIPTFGIQWNQVSGSPATIVNPNSQNTNITGLNVGIYSFEIIVTNACGVFKDTVNLNFTSVLPVTLINFSGDKVDKDDFLQWDVADEINLKQYELEISEDANRFSNLVTIPINLSSSNFKKYSYTNKNVKGITNYYKLKMINNDGSFSYSNIIKLSRKGNKSDYLEVNPVPAKNNLSVILNSTKAYSSGIEIIDVQGKIVYKKRFEVYSGSNSTSIDVSLLARGFYLVRIGDLSQKILLQ